MFRISPFAALGTVARMFVFKNLQIGRLPKKQEVASLNRSGWGSERPRLLKLEETTIYGFDYSSKARLVQYCIALKTLGLKSSFI